MGDAAKKILPALAKLIFASPSLARGFVGIAIVLSGCGSRTPAPRPEPTLPPGPPTPSAPAASASATPTASVGADAEGAPPEPRPRLSGALAEQEAMLRDVCSIEYIRVNGAVTNVGCTGCIYEDTSFDPDAYRFSDLPTWAPAATLRGAFGPSGESGAFLQLAGGCNAKHGGFAFLSQKGGHWSLGSRNPAFETGACRVVGRATKTAAVVCLLQRVQLSSASSELFMLDPSGLQSSLIVFRHASRYSLPQSVHKDATITSFDLVDLNHDGLSDIVAKVAARQATGAALQEWQETNQWDALPVLSTEQLEFVQVKAGFEPTPKTKARIAAWTKLLPRE